MILPVSPLASLQRAPRKAKSRRPRVVLPPMPGLDVKVVQRVEFVLEGPPVPKRRARSGTQGGRHYTPEVTRQFEEAVQRAGWAALARFGMLNSWPLDVYYFVTVRAFFPDARRGDADNVLKSVCDALNEVTWRDDSQVIDMFPRKRIDRERPRTEVVIEVIT